MTVCFAGMRPRSAAEPGHATRPRRHARRTTGHDPGPTRRAQRCGAIVSSSIVRGTALVRATPTRYGVTLIAYGASSFDHRRSRASTIEDIVNPHENRVRPSQSQNDTDHSLPHFETQVTTLLLGNFWLVKSGYAAP